MKQLRKNKFSYYLDLIIFGQWLHLLKSKAHVNNEVEVEVIAK